MTVFGWDQSHYDAPMTVRDGIDLVTHKCAEGHHFYKDNEYQASMNSARALGVPILGAYFVNHPGTVSDQVDWFLSIVNAETPWWKDVPWIWQIDAEKFQYMSRAPSIAEINAFGDTIAARTNSPANSIFAYAPPWLYGDQLKGLKYPLWSSNYGNNPVAHYKAAYPGDVSSRWIAVPGLVATFLQYGSNTTIGNQTTCDANAYRGTLAQLLQFIGRSGLAPELPEGYSMRYSFVNFADIPDGVGNRVHVTDGVRYKVMQNGQVWAGLAGQAGAGPVTLVDGKATGGSYKVAVATLCGSLDSGEVDAKDIAEQLAANPAFVQALATALAAQLPKPAMHGTWNTTE